jgi:hypothetical protein
MVGSYDVYYILDYDLSDYESDITEFAVTTVIDVIFAMAVLRLIYAKHKDVID